MKAVIMAGGKEVRLQPYTLILPKPMLPLGDRPILAWLLGRLVGAGVTNVTLAVHYLDYVFRSCFGNGSRLGLHIRYQHEKEPLGTAGALRCARMFSEPFLVTNADIVTNLDFAELARFHRNRNAWLTIATQLRTTQSPMGVLDTDGEKVVAYKEKPAHRERIGLGIYMIDPWALQYLPDHGRCDMQELVWNLLDAGQPVLHYETQSLWFDLGSPEEYRSVSDHWPGILAAQPEAQP